MQLTISIYYRTDVPISQTKNEMAYAFCFIKKYWGRGGAGLKPRLVLCLTHLGIFSIGGNIHDQFHRDIE